MFNSLLTPFGSPVIGGQKPATLLQIRHKIYFLIKHIYYKNNFDHLLKRKKNAKSNLPFAFFYCTIFSLENYSKLIRRLLRFLCSSLFLLWKYEVKYYCKQEHYSYTVLCKYRLHYLREDRENLRCLCKTKTNT